MKICILSDSHDNRKPLKQAADDAIAQGAEAILHCGDLVAPSTLFALKHIDIPIHVIHGNNTGDLHAMSKMSQREAGKIIYYGQDASIELAGKRIFIVHYPHYALGMATTGKWDMVCCGHSHKAKIESVANIMGSETMIVNPGTVGAVANPATYAMCDLNTLQADIHTLPGDWS